MSPVSRGLHPSQESSRNQPKINPRGVGGAFGEQERVG